MGVQVTYNPQELNAQNSVWVDVVYGDDDLGGLDRRDFPFRTLEAAWTAVNAAPAGNYIIHLSPGTHTVTATLVTKTGYNYKLVSESRYNLINFVPTVVTDSLFDRATAGSITDIELYYGTYRNNGGTGIFMNDGQNTHRYEFIDIDIDDRTGSETISKGAGVRAEFCRIISLVGDSLTGMGETSEFVAFDTYIESTAGNICSDQDMLNFRLIGSTASAPTGNIHQGRLSQVDMHGSTLVSFDTCLKGQPVQLTAMGGTCSIAVTQDVPVIIVDSDYVNDDIEALLLMDTISLKQPVYSTTPCIQLEQSTNPGTREDQPVRYAVTSVLAFQDGCDPEDGTFPTAGAIGTVLTSATATNTITVDLPNAYSGSPIPVVLSTSDIATSIAELKTAIDAQVNTPGTTWADWCGGDDTNVEITTTNVANDTITVKGATGIPAGYRISNSATNYFNLGTDTGTIANVAPTLVEIGGGNLLPIDNNIIRYNSPTTGILNVMFGPTVSWRRINYL